MGNRRVRDGLFNATIATAVTTILLLFMEAGLRAIDGYSLISFELVATGTRDSSGAGAISARYATSIPAPEGIKREWFDLRLPPIPSKKPLDEIDRMVARYGRDRQVKKIIRRIWNDQFLLNALDLNNDFADFFKKLPDTFFVFSASGLVPRYRLFPDDPSPEGMPPNLGMITNNLGYRGPDIPVAKQPRTIRIAFLGASTTIEHPDEKFSYPEYTVFWLNVWAKANGIDVHFEVVNAAREGFQSSDLAAVTTQELLRLRPDLVVYMGGANEFTFRDLLTMLPATGKQYQKVSAAFLNYHSAIALRISNLYFAVTGGELREVEKPPYEVRWPNGLDENDPDIARGDLPLQLSPILSDLDSIRASLNTIGAELAVSSFLWLGREGMVLDPVRHRSIYWYLNGYEAFWPYRYADIRRFADFQNRVWEKYCLQKGCHFIDLARTYPLDPDLFIDGIHENTAGIKLHGWVTFLKLLPIVKRKIESGVWPNMPENVADPAPSYRRTSLKELESLYHYRQLPLPLSLAWHPLSGVTVTSEADGIHVKGDNGKLTYQIVSDSIPIETNAHYAVELNLHIEAGHVGIGVLDQSEMKWLHAPIDIQKLSFNTGENHSIKLVIANNNSGDALDVSRFVILSGAEHGASLKPKSLLGSLAIAHHDVILQWLGGVAP